MDNQPIVLLARRILAIITRLTVLPFRHTTRLKRHTALARIHPAPMALIDPFRDRFWNADRPIP